MSDFKWKPVIPANLATLSTDLRRVFHSGVTLPREWRIKQLNALKRMTEENVTAIEAALKEDLGRPLQEARIGDTGDVIKECDAALTDLDEWMKPEKVAPVVATIAHGSYRYSDPLGVVLIIAPWNFPYALAMNPLVGAIAAGNCAVIKPSEISPHTSALIASLVPRYLDSNCIVVAEGGIPESTTLLNQQWDLIFYTGSTSVGKIVMQAAAKHLTPVVLELGGKCPVYIDKAANLAIAAKRVAWGKFFNCGQVCLAPDYILVHTDVHDKFMQLLKQAVQNMYGDDPKGSASLGRVVNKQHCNRLLKLLDDPASKFKVEIGGADKAKPDERFIPPTILSGVSPDALIMQDEIFGPLCPVLKVPDHKAALQFVKERPKPLALYVFTEDKAIADLFLTNTSSGGACVNEVVMHITNHHLPFGGVGPSGMGAYHNKASFDCFSHKKSVLWAGTGATTEISARYAPYSESSLKTFGLIGAVSNLEFKLKPVTRHLSLERIIILILAAVLLWKQMCH